MGHLQDELRHYTKLARKSRGAPMTFTEYNSRHKADIPTDAVSDSIYGSFVSSLKRAKAANGLPVQGRLFNLVRAFHSEMSPIFNAPKVKTMLPSPTQTLQPTSSRNITPTATVAVKKEYTMDHYKEDRTRWLQAHAQSKLHKETQVVFFVPNEKIENYEHYATKLTKATGQILQNGGIFKMRSGLKKEILGVDKEAAAKVLQMVKSGEKGPYYVPISCITGAKICIC